MICGHVADPGSYSDHQRDSRWTAFHRAPYMTFDISAIRPLVQQILNAPDTDFATISARRIRKQLPELTDSLTPETLKEHKRVIDAIIAEEFDNYIAAHPRPDDDDAEEDSAEEDSEPSSRKRKQEDSDGEADDDIDDAPSPKKKAKSAASTTMSDAEMARQLSNELNGRERRSTARGGKKAAAGGAAKKAAKRGSRAKKSAATVEDSDSDGTGTPAPKPKKASSGGAKGGFGREFALR